LADLKVVVTSRSTITNESDENSDESPIYRLKPWFKLSNTPFNPLWPLIIRKIIKIEKPDIIIAHTPVPSMADAAALVAGKTPFILTNHAATVLKQGSTLFNIAARIYNALSFYTLRRADKIFAVSDFVRDQLPARLQAKTVVLPNAVWPDQIKKRSQPKKTEFIFIGSLNRSHAWKGLDLIIKAMDIYVQSYDSHVSLTVIGDGNNKLTYEKQAAEYGISSNIKFKGALTGSKKDRFLQKASALILYPTTNNDAFPTVILEAWAKYVPVIAAAIGPMPSLLNDRKDSYLCEPDSPKILAQTMRSVAISSQVERAKVSSTAAKRLTQSYTWDKQAKLVSSVVGGLL
jgi:glycosyltransferase involved in cell wall biosynthesis